MSGSETATIDIDSVGRMWVAYDTASTVRVQYSDAPYASFSSPITLAAGIATDDIAAVTAMPGQVGVMWSNQNSKRFGFRTHVDGASASTWTPDEVPASQSAVNVGGGMADDHINLTAGSDGTLYAAVKTSYNSSKQPAIGLLVRRPSGSWDRLYPVDGSGTRGIVVLNEEDETVRVIYSAAVNYADIMTRTASMADLSFGAAQTLMSGRFNNATSTKENWTGQVVGLASGVTTARAFVIGAGATPPKPDPVAPVAADGTLMVMQGQSADGTLRVTASSGQPLTYEVLRAPTKGTVVLRDAGTGVFAYAAAATADGTDSFTFRVQEGGLWSAPATVSITISASSAVRGVWLLDEGGGTVVGDGSGL
ncbi:Ig-like domain-containing protein, partial [Georgenia yuyongxinii]